MQLEVYSSDAGRCPKQKSGKTKANSSITVLDVTRSNQLHISTKIEAGQIFMPPRDKQLNVGVY